jgi:hypothetical protein
VIFFWLIPIGLLGARILWQRRPGLLTSALFWAIALVLVVLSWTLDVSSVLFAAGIGGNAAVTLANGGYMPVSAHRKLRGPARSVWVQRESGQHLLFLADNFGNRYIRFSVGDVLLASGLIVSIFGY